MMLTAARSMLRDLREHVRQQRLASFSVFFVTLKAVAYLSPLLLASIVTRTVYGDVEWVLSVGNIMAPFIALGIPASVPYYLLERKEPRFATLFEAVTFALGAGTVGAVAGYLLMSDPPLGLLGFAVGLAFAAQLVLSANLKTEGGIRSALLVDTGPYLILAGVVVSAVCRADAPVLRLFAVGLAVFGVAVCVVACARMAHRPLPPHTWATLVAAVRFGVPAVASGAFTVWLVTSARPLLGMFVSAEAIADYSLLFRIASAAVLVHQLLLAAFMRQLYVATSERLDVVLSRVLVLVALVLFACMWILPIVLRSWLPEVRAVLAGAPSLRPIIAAHVFLWITTALLEMHIYRIEAAGPIAIAGASITATLWLSCTVLGAVTRIDIVTIARLNAVALLALALCHLFVLRARRRVVLDRVLQVVIGTMIVAGIGDIVLTE